jgi:hypothetical protein
MNYGENEKTTYYDQPVGSGVSLEDKIRQINIEELNRGYIVKVGCHNFAISTKDELTRLLVKYINEPIKTEKLWFDGKLFNN